MKKLVVVAVLSLIGGILLANAWHRSGAKSAPSASASNRKILYYVDPMHPAYKSDKPGIAPDCGMELVPVFEGETVGSQSGPAGVVNISPERQQLIGVRVSPVEKKTAIYTLRLFGKVAADESRVYKLDAGIDGYIQDVSEVTTGSRVRKNQLLATFGAPNASMMVQSFLLNVGAEDRYTKAAANGEPEGQSVPSAFSNVQQRTQQLRNLGMSQLQIEEIRRTRQVPESIKIVSPEDGFVLARNVSPGMKFDRGAEWFRIADLKHIWILADVFEGDVQRIRPGMPARITLASQQKTIPTTVSAVLPQVDPATHTFKVRLEIDNPQFMLRPEMFVTVEIPMRSTAMSVPADAILDAGLTKTVFVEAGEGLFEPRQVETGQRFDNAVEIVKGLAEGERVVVSGNFLLSSEARLTGTADRVSPDHSARAGLPRMNSHPQDRQNGGAASALMATDPSCGMEVDVEKSKAAGRTSQSGNKTYYFCSDGCKRKFDADPSRRHG